MNRFIWLGVTALAVTSSGSGMLNHKTPEIAPARDGNIAIKEELCLARKAGTVAALDLFIARHPQHPLAEIARKERAELRLRETDALD